MIARKTRAGSAVMMCCGESPGVLGSAITKAADRRPMPSAEPPYSHRARAARPQTSPLRVGQRFGPLSYTGDRLTYAKHPVRLVATDAHGGTATKS